MKEIFHPIKSTTRQDKVLDILFIISIFAYSGVLLRSPVDVYHAYIPFILLLPVFILKYGPPKILLAVFLPLVLAGIGSIYLGLNQVALFLKIALGLFFSAAFFYYFIRHYSFNVSRLFRLYMNACFVTVLIGFVQIVGHTIGIRPLYDLGWIFNKWGVAEGGLGIRVNSVFAEPAYFAATLAPAFFVSFHNLIIKKPHFFSKQKSIILMVGYFLTFSSLGVIVVFISSFFILLRFGYLKLAILVVPISVLGFQFIYNNVEDFRERFDGTSEAFFGEGEVNAFAVHGSSFILYDNYQVATKNFSDYPLFGTGLGSHKVAFDKHTLTKSFREVGLDGNAADANSMFLRIMSETGLYGLIFITLFLFRNFIGINTALNEEFWAMSIGCLILIIIYLLRQGHYFFNGLPFFMWVYYYLSKISKNPEMYGHKRD